MTPVDLQAAPLHQGAIIRAYQNQIEALQIQQMSQAPAPTPTPHNESQRMSLPEKYDRSPDCCRDFICQCDIIFALQPELYAADTTRCAFVLSLLTGKALDWASAVWNTDPQVQTSFVYFAGLIHEVFEYPAQGKDVSVQLMEPSMFNYFRGKPKHQHSFSPIQRIWHFDMVFSKETASQLPPHHPWDCAIELLPNAMPPKCRVYPLSLPENKAMEDYIEEALSAGHIHPSTSPAAAGLEFCIWPRQFSDYCFA